MKPRFHLLTYGCQMNVCEAGIVRSILTGAGFAESSDPDSADLVLMLTCSVRSSAEQRALGRLSSLRSFSGEQKNRVIAVLGCMAQNLGRRLTDEYGADIVAGPDEYRLLPELYEQARNGQGRLVHTRLTGECYDDVMPLPDNRVSAFVTVMRGCNNRCSYCIVPLVKGSERCRPFDSIVGEVSALLQQGIVEITLLGQNILAYQDGSRRFPDLLRAVARLPGLLRLRFLTSHPRDLDESLLAAIIESGACPALHLPLQSGSDRILGLMERGYTKDEYLAKVRMARSLLPEIGLTTDVMVGFPSETEQDFEETLNVIETVRFDYAYMFRFSPRPGTAATGIKPAVSNADAGRRLARLVEIQNRITAERNRELVGRTLELLIEGQAPRGGMLGRTATNRPVVVDAAVKPGELILGRVTHLQGWTPVAEPVAGEKFRRQSAVLVSAGRED